MILKNFILEVIKIEKDNFSDRSNESKIWNEINIGDIVYVCEKYMQKSACEIDHLTRGVVTKKLSKDDHPRGIKVKINMLAYGNEIYGASGSKELVGRCVYLERDGIIIRNTN